MSCTPPASAEGSPRLSLPVVPARPTVVRPSRMGKWRALSLIAIHVAFLVHVLHWKATGRTLSPVEPSESMESLATGRVNAGALFFAAALASTLLFGRFLCGWGCHMVAVQDLCGWLMRRAGFRPKPFRSRLLVFVPLGAAIYMFIWPTAYRLWVGAPPPPVTTHLFKSQFWATFPGPVVAVLTLLICGGAIVYFLGNKGFCTYACPYGGFFGLLDRAAPLRVRVTDACNRCGHCSAACSSNVRVAEEVHLFKMVVDPGCMKCLDCVSVCPNDALYVGLGRPALAAPRAAQPRKPLRHDGGWGTELALLAIFGVSLLVWRGLYGQVPFLFSLGLSSITAYLLLRLWHLASRADVTFHRLALRRRGTIRPAGWAYVVAALLLLAFLAHCGWVQFNQAGGDAAFSPAPRARQASRRWSRAGSSRRRSTR
ncbi:MAG: 4Fe-4S binding protein [Phycisphaerae bacterium]